MATKTHTYKVQKGDDVRPRFVGAEIPTTEYTTIAEAVDGGHFDSEAAILGAAYPTRRIAQNRIVRKALSVETGNVADAVAKAAAVKMGTPKEKGEGSPKTKAAREVVGKAKETMGRVEAAIRKNAGNEAGLKQLLAFEIVTQADIDTVLAKMAAEAAVTKAAASATGTTPEAPKVETAATKPTNGTTSKAGSKK